MRRCSTVHVVRAAAAITGDSEIVVIGSTSIPGQFPNAPVEMLGSIEVQRDVLLDRLGSMDADPVFRQILRESNRRRFQPPAR